MGSGKRQERSQRELNRAELHALAQSLQARCVAFGDLLNTQQRQISGLSEGIGGLTAPIRMLKLRHEALQEVHGDEAFMDAKMEAYLEQLFVLEGSFVVTDVTVPVGGDAPAPTDQDGATLPTLEAVSTQASAPAES